MISVILFGFAILGQSRSFPFDCDQIMEWNTEIIETSTRPLSFSFSLFDGNSNTEKPLETPTPEKNKWVITHVFSTLKTNLRNRFRSTQQSINYQVCTVIVQELEKVYQNPFFQVAVIFAMYLLFYGVMRMLVWILTLLAWILFQVLRLFGLYQTKISLQEVEEIE